MTRRQWIHACVLFLSFAGVGFSVAGCGAPTAESGWKLTSVAGRVTWKGQPVQDADVAFYLDNPSADGYVGSAGRTDAAGRYTLMAGQRKGAQPGRYVVTVSKRVTKAGKPLAVASAPGLDPEQLVLQGLVRELLPERYSSRQESELKIEVADDSPQGSYDLELD